MSDQGEAPRPSWAEVDELRTFSIAEQIEDMRRMVRDEAASRTEVEAFVDASRERERRLTKAIAALEGVPLGAGGKPKAKAAPPPPKPRAQPVHPRVADTVLDAAKALLADGRSEQTFSRPELVEAIPDTSGETIRRGLVLLREQQRIRLAGKQGKGPTARNLYALMP